MARAPLLYCGVASGGTTYSLRLMNAISKVQLSFEARMLKEGLHRFSKLRSDTRDEVFDALEDMCIGESESGKNTVLIDAIRKHKELLYNVWRGDRSYSRMMSEVYRIAYGKPIWGDKMLRIEYAFDFLKQAPDTKFIVHYRDPRAVAASIEKKYQGRSGYTQTCGYWNTHYILGQKLLTQYPDQTLMVRYEDLMEKPVETLRRIIAFVDPALVHEAESIIANRPPDVSRMTQWQNTLTRAAIEEIEGICYTGMSRLGYSPRFASHQKRQSRTKYLLANVAYYRRFLLRPSVIARKQLLRRLRIMLGNLNPK